MPAVVGVAYSVGAPSCTGTVVGPYAVVTAKHCVFYTAADGTEIPVEPSDLVVEVGDNLTSERWIEDVIGVVEIRTTPGNDIRRDVAYGDDIAILLLNEDALVTPVDVATEPPQIGDVLTLVGFGRTQTGVPLLGDYGHKRRGMAEVVDTYVGVFLSDGESWLCNGDNGGPALDASMAITGIASFGLNQNCVNDVSGFTEISRHSDLVTEALSFVPICSPRPEECDRRDNDCNSVVDDGCTALGDACRVNAECESERCEVVGDGSQCVEACDPTATSSCSAGFRCEADGCAEGRCIRGGVDTGGRPCVQGGARCGAEEVCEVVSPECGRCTPFDVATGSRTLGDRCDNDSQCLEGPCFEGRCSRPCSDAERCPSDSHCRAGQCVYGPLGALGDRCVSGEDCSTVAPECVTDGEQLCAQRCGDSNRCPSGFECSPSNVGDRCLPEGLPLGASCATNGECRSQMCMMECTRACEAPTDCPSGFECAGSMCVRSAIDESGCSCSVPGVGGRGASIFWLFLAGLMGQARWRRHPRT